MVMRTLLYADEDIMIYCEEDVMKYADEDIMVILWCGCYDIL